MPVKSGVPDKKQLYRLLAGAWLDFTCISGHWWWDFVVSNVGVMGLLLLLLYRGASEALRRRAWELEMLAMRAVYNCCF